MLSCPQEKWRILTIDDNAAIHQDYRKVLTPDSTDQSLSEVESLLFGDECKKECGQQFNYQIDSAFQGLDGIKMVQQAIEEGNPYSAALIDIRMPPGIDGIETACRIWEIDPDLPLVLCTAYSDYSWSQITEELPQTDKLLILKKPFDPVELRQIAASQVTRWHLNRLASQNEAYLEKIIERRTREIESTRDVVFASLAKLAESRDQDTGEHLDRIERYTRILLERLAETGSYEGGIDQGYVDYVSRSSVLHDIGKVGIPDSILLKPGRLTKEEFEIMKTHTVIGAEALDDAAKDSKYCDFLFAAAEIARYHHEKYNGTGYPDQLVGQAIPLSARVVAVADVFDALTSERVYKSAMCPHEAKALIASESGKHFDPAIVEAFIQCWDLFHELALENQSQAKAATKTKAATESKGETVDAINSTHDIPKE